MAKPNLKPVAAHYSGAFFVKSETFIYHYLTHLQTFTPICLAWKLENLSDFVFPAGDIYSLQLPRGSFQWVWNGLFKRLLHRDLYAKRILKNRQAKLLHAHFGHNGVQALELIPTLKRSIPLITTFYGADLSRKIVVESLKEQYSELFSEGDLFLVEGPFMKEALHGLGCPLEKIEIQRIAIPVETIRFKERKPKAKASEAVRFLFCGRFTEKKGLSYALEAMKRVWNDYGRKNIRFCVIGDGELKPGIEAFIEENHMHEYVELRGFLNYSQYLQRFDEADIFIHPSVTAEDGDSEGGAPTTILEAQAKGLPVISTFHADIPNVVAPGVSALLSAERDVEGLVRNILFLLDNQDVWSDMGYAGRNFVETYHDVNKEVLNLEDHYKSMIGG